MSESTINGAVIGYGGAYSMGKNHLNWMRTAGITPYAACDIDPERVGTAEADFPGIKTFTDYKELLSDPAVDVVVDILPHSLHAKVNLDIVSAGKHCVCEKPFTLTVAEADACIAAAKAKGVTLTVFHNRRFDGDHRAMLELIENGDIGEVFHVEGGFGGFNEPGAIWRSDKAVSGGNLYDWGVHFIDWMLRLIPDPIENVTGFYHKRVWNNVTNEDYTKAIIRFRSDKEAEVTISNIEAAPRPKFRILGTKGAIVMDGMFPGAFTVRRYIDGKVEEEQVDYAGRGYPDTGEAYYSNLVAHLRNGEPLAVTPESARRNIAVLEAAGKSAVSHKAEAVAHEN